MDYAITIQDKQWLSILALNLNSAMKRLTLGKSWMPKRMKAMRFSLINIPGHIIEHSREFIIRLVQDHPAADLLIDARSRIMALSWAPSG